MLAVYLINLDGSDARLAQATQALNAAGISFQRLAAFDGRGKRPVDLPLYDEAAALKGFGRRLSGGEVGCFLSHLDGARRFLASEADLGLVLEDDLSVAPDALGALAQMRPGDCGGPWWVGNLGERPKHWVTPVQDLGQGRMLVRAHYFPVTTTAILWNRAGAEAFLRDAKVIDMPVDHWLRHWATKARAGIAVTPPLFPQAGLASEIDAGVARKSGQRGLRYSLLKYARMWRNKSRAKAAMAAFVRSGPP